MSFDRKGVLASAEKLCIGISPLLEFRIQVPEPGPHLVKFCFLICSTIGLRSPQFLNRFVKLSIEGMWAIRFVEGVFKVDSES